MKTKGTNQFKNKYKYIWGLSSEAIISIFQLLILILILAIIAYKMQPKVISMIPDKIVYAEEPKSLTIDEMVDKYSKQFGKTRWEQNRFKAMTHYLLLREQNYGGSNAMGDNGLAGGPMQFHAGTYTANRQRMIDKGLTDHMGSRFDMEDSISTAIYMFSLKQEKQWGPVARNEIIL
jgi:hypothetical protein